MSQSENVAGADASVWKVGSLSVDELERLAGEIRPSWEIGLDAAAEQPANAAAAMIVPTASGFTAASNAVVADLGGLVNTAPKGNVTQVMGAVLAPANATLVAQAGPNSENPAVPLHASSGRMTSPIPLVAPARPPQAQQMAYDDAKTEQSTARPWEDDESFAPKKKGKGLLFGVLGGGVVVAGLIAFLAMRGGESTAANTASATTASEAAPSSASAPSASSTAPSTVAVNPAPTTNAAEHVAPPPPARAIVQTAAMAPAPPAPAAAPAIARPAPQPSPVAATHASSSSRIASERSSSHHSSSGSSARRGGSRVHGAGFVTDSPY